MTSFIDLLASYVWSEVDIVSRTEALVRSQISTTDERIINRKLQGAMMGQYTLSVAEQDEVERFARVTQEAQAAGAAARADMVLLQGALDVEAAQRRLAVPPVAPVEEGAEVSGDGVVDAQERAAAQAVVDAAGPAVLDLVALRNPAPQVQP